jgi:PTH1 family peptidyl-tRNA hydrolase
MRIGIGHPGAKELVNGHVLHDFGKADQDWLAPLLAAIAENAPLLAKGDDSSFMNRVHLATAGPEEARPPPAPPRGSAGSKADEPRSVGALADSLMKLLRREN